MVSCHAIDAMIVANHIQPFGNHFKSSANKLILVPQSDGLFWDLPRYRQGKRTPKGTNFPVKRLPMRRLYGPKGWCNLTISHNVTLTVCWSRKPPFLLTLLSQCSGAANHYRIIAFIQIYRHRDECHRDFTSHPLTTDGPGIGYGYRL